MDRNRLSWRFRNEDIAFGSGKTNFIQQWVIIPVQFGEYFPEKLRQFVNRICIDDFYHGIYLI